MSAFKKILIACASSGVIFSLAFATKSLYAEIIESPNASALITETLNGGVNITPLWAKNNGDTSEVSYRVSFSPILYQQRDNPEFTRWESKNGLFMLVPKNAENIRFNLIGTTRDLFSGVPADVNFPLNICENHETCTISPLPTYEEIESGDEKLQNPHVRKMTENEMKAMMNIDINEVIYPKVDSRLWFRIDKYDVYHVVWPAKDLINDPSYSCSFFRMDCLAGKSRGIPVAFDINFSLPNSQDEQYIPMRALLNIGCQVTRNNSYIHGIKEIYYDREWNPDELLNFCSLTFIHDNFDNMNATMPLPDNIPTEKHEKYYPNIEKGDFDEHGLYLNERGCVVTRNFEDWYKIGDDLWSSPSGNYLNLWYKDKNYVTWTWEWVPSNEDLCDQAVVVIPGNNE